mgnify:CR=1 FL=1
MSCYAWEHGTITLPSGQAPLLRKALTEAAEKRIATLSADAAAAWDLLRVLPAAKRAQVAGWDSRFDRLDPEAVWLLQRCGAKAGKTGWARPTQKAIRESVVTRSKDFDGVTATVFHLGEASIALRGNTVTWSVPENNHAPERAANHPLAGVLFDFLSRVPWTSRSGGQIVGNDEYHRDSYDAGGGGNYVVRDYGKASKRRPAALNAGRRW